MANAMTRKHFEELAYAINWNSENLDEALRTVSIIEDALSHCSGLTPNGNRRFDTERFRKAATKRFTHD